jgi:hypothetical protein
MTFRFDPQIDARLGPTVAGLHADGSAPGSAHLDSRAPATRTARWVLVIVAALLVALAVPAVVWLSHTGPLPSTAALHCADVDPFRCHDSATKAAAAVRPGASIGLAPLTAVGKSGFEIVEIGVRQGSLPRTACDIGPCPPAIAHLLEQISYVDIVTVHYQDGRLPPPETTGSVEVQVTRYGDGREVAGPILPGTPALN